MNKFKERTLGHTGRSVGRSGLAASYGASTKAFEETFETRYIFIEPVGLVDTVDIILPTKNKTHKGAPYAGS